MTGLVQWLGVLPKVCESPGEGFWFRYQDKVYRAECWYGRNGSGTDFYDVDGAPATPFPREDDLLTDQFDEELNLIRSAWDDAVVELVDPAYEAAHLRTLRQVGEDPDHTSSASRQHYIDTGWYLPGDATSTRKRLTSATCLDCGHDHDGDEAEIANDYGSCVACRKDSNRILWRFTDGTSEITGGDQ